VCGPSCMHADAASTRQHPYLSPWHIKQAPSAQRIPPHQHIRPRVLRPKHTGVAHKLQRPVLHACMWELRTASCDSCMRAAWSASLRFTAHRAGPARRAGPAHRAGAAARDACMRKMHAGRCGGALQSYTSAWEVWVVKWWTPWLCRPRPRGLHEGCPVALR
jgi:hypothetical protein